MTNLPSTPSARPGCLHYLLFVIASLAVIIASGAIHLITWGVDQVLLTSSIYLPWYVWFLISLGHALLIAVLTVPLAVFVHAPRFRAAYQTWAMSAGLVALFALARVFSAMQLQPASVALVILVLIATIVLIMIARRRNGTFTRNGNDLAIALILAPIIAAPMLAFGALGSPTDTVLTFLAGLAFGLCAAILLTTFLLQPLAVDETKPSRVFAAFSVGVALTILATGYGVPGAQLLLLVVIPSLAFLIAALNRSWLAIATLIGLIAAATLMFFDPVELALVLSLATNGELLVWALRAIGITFAIAIVLGIVALILTRTKFHLPTAVAWSGVVIVWFASLALFFFVGQPGFYGEQLFVILKDQADLSRAPSITDRNERLRFVYSTLTQQANRTQANLRATMNQLGLAYRPYYLVNAMEVNGGPILRAYLMTQLEVDRVIDSPHLRPLPEPLQPSKGDLPAPTEPLWNIQFIGVDRVWEELKITGKGIVVGESDSGVQGSHPALRDAYRGKSSGNDYNWLDPWYGSNAPTDIGGHGTHTLGTIVGRGGIGIAPDAEWFACINLARNLGNPPDYLNCLQFMLAPYPQNGDPLRDGDPTRAAHVLNNSWACPPLEGCDANSLKPAIDALRAAGIFVVASAGNNGPRCDSIIEPPAIYDNAFSVGAINSDGMLSLFSSRGPVTVDGSNRIKPDILAPGEEIISSFPGNSYASEMGTSMAGPHVVGVVVLMWSANPKLIGDIDRTEKILIETAKPYQGQVDTCGSNGVPNNATGYGIVDAYAAVKAALAAK
ncbi:MAG: S8 family serine peptidase [Chloroflexi bacterium]|nr:S8 family serine peptidase [Chloroflexota bacterium]